MVGALGRARLTIGIDVNFGDPVWPAPGLVELPRIVSLGQPPLTLLGYPLTMIFAEKIVTAIDRGEANTRWRDFADVFTLARSHKVDAAELRASLESVAAYRHVELAPLLPTLATMPDYAQPKWRAWRTRVGREHDLPEQFEQVLRAVARFADPVLARSGVRDWDPDSEVWDP
jgi:hypothetical protein